MSFFTVDPPTYNPKGAKDFASKGDPASFLKDAFSYFDGSASFGRQWILPIIDEGLAESRLLSYLLQCNISSLLLLSLIGITASQAMPGEKFSTCTSFVKLSGDSSIEAMMNVCSRKVPLVQYSVVLISLPSLFAVFLALCVKKLNTFTSTNLTKYSLSNRMKETMKNEVEKLDFHKLMLFSKWKEVTTTAIRVMNMRRLQLNFTLMIEKRQMCTTTVTIFLGSLLFVSIMAGVKNHFYHSINYGCEEYFPDPKGSTVIYASCYFPEIKYLIKILDVYTFTSYGLSIMNFVLVIALLIAQNTCCKFEDKILGRKIPDENDLDLDKMMIENRSNSNIMNKIECKHIMDDDMHKIMAANVRLPFLEFCLPPKEKDQTVKPKSIEGFLKVENTDFKEHIKNFVKNDNEWNDFILRVQKERARQEQATGSAASQNSESETQAKQISTSESNKSLTTASLWSRSEWSDSSRFVPQFSSSSTFSSMK